MRLEIYNLEGLNFVELNITGDNDNYKRCDSESSYLDSEVFNLFSDCFEAANKLYEYFGPTKYNSRKIIVLRNELLNNLEKLNVIQSKKDFIAFIKSKLWGQDFIDTLSNEKEKWVDNWDYFLGKLISINREFVTLCERCADEERILWVVGY